MHNNPLSFTDPTGFSKWTKFRDKVLRPVLSIAVFFTGIPVFAAGFISSYISTGSLQGAVIGAFSAGVMGGLEGLGQVAGFFARGAMGGFFSLVGGGKFGHGFVSAGVMGTVGAKLGHGFGGTMAKMVLGGTISKATGGKFANGAAFAAFSMAVQGISSNAADSDTLEEVVVKEPWEKPVVGNAPPQSVTSEQATKMYSESPYEPITVDEASAQEVESVRSSKPFGKEARRIYQASRSREMGALRVYENGGDYHVYSVGTPNPAKANGLILQDVNPSLGRHVFDWHPHPWGSPTPSPADLRHSFKTGVPGVIRFDRRGRTIYQGGCKAGFSC